MKELKQSLKFMQYAPFLFISALTGQRTHKVLSMIKGCYDNYDKKIGTGVLNDVIGKALLQKEPPMVGTKRLRVYYGTQTGTKPPTFVFFINDQSALHFSYTRYIENQLRDAFDFAGTGLKIEYREKRRNEDS
jgi:GTP-binding protein